MNQIAIDWNADAAMPVSGSTPLARHCSATGAQAATIMAGSKMARLLTLFAQHRRLTLNECATLLGVQDHALCSTWNRAKAAMGWIEETGEVRRKQIHRTGHDKPVYVSQAYHRITDAGRRAAFDQLRVRVAGLEVQA